MEIGTGAKHQELSPKSHQQTIACSEALIFPSKFYAQLVEPALQICSGPTKYPSSLFASTETDSRATEGSNWDMLIVENNISSKETFASKACHTKTSPQRNAKDSNQSSVGYRSRIILSGDIWLWGLIFVEELSYFTASISSIYDCSSVSWFTTSNRRKGSKPGQVYE